MPKSSGSPDDIERFLEDAVAAAREVRADIVFVAPDDPLAWGLVDRLQEAGIAAFGPTARAAEIEGSKGFAKALMSRYGIPSAQGRSFDSIERARRHLQEAEPPFVVKADGLAAGKGVTVAPTREAALGALFAIMTDRTFGKAGERVVIEEYLEGNEVSVHAFSDGKTFQMMPFARDHKRIFDGNEGPNTGGMGAITPVPGTDALKERIESQVVEPALRALREEGRPFKGVLYPGLMVGEGGIKVLEFNARFGDPEAEILLPLLETDLLDVADAVVNERLDSTDIRWSSDAAIGVVMASAGYPEKYTTGHAITGLDSLDPGIEVFLAGVQNGDDLRTGGGRVLVLVARAATLAEARDRAYDNVRRVHFEGAHYRRDLGLSAL